MDRKSEILNFIKNQRLAVISTINAQGLPESAVIGFGETEDFGLVFGTYNDSRKYQNLQSNPDVALVIGWDDGSKTVQYEGRARELGGAEAEKYAQIYTAKNPAAAIYKDNPKQRYFLNKPKWLRFTDIKKEPWDMAEVSFN